MSAVIVQTAEVWVGAGRRFFTRKAAERAVVKDAIRAFLRGTGDDHLAPEEFHRVMVALVPRVAAGGMISAEDVAEVIEQP